MGNNDMGIGKDIDENEVRDTGVSGELGGDNLDGDVGYDATIVMETDDDDVAIIDMSAEINVEELVAKFEATDSDDVERKQAIRRRLEQLAEERDIDLDSTYNFNLNTDEV